MLSPTRWLICISTLLALNLTQAEKAKPVERDKSVYKLEQVATNLDIPWSIAFLPDGSMLVTELRGRLRVIRDGKLFETPVPGTPEVFFAGQGGLFDIVLHPDFAKNQTVFLSYADGNWGKTATRVVRARFTGAELRDVEVVFETNPKRRRAVHYGGRMAFLPDGSLLVTLGDAFDDRELAQQLDSHTGTIVRISENGTAPFDNPFVSNTEARPEIWSYGHRNVQAIVVDSQSGRVYANEHGPRGGDELNLIEAGKNYGWPAITYGIDYSGAMISPYTELPGMEQPLLQWTPSIAPSGMTLYNGSDFPQWQGNLFVTSLVFNRVDRIERNERGEYRVVESLFEDIGERLRDIRTGPDGHLYILAEGTPGTIWRVVPVTADNH